MYKGTTQKGLEVYTKNQTKKHITQMTAKEKDEILKRIHSLPLSYLRYSQHALSKVNTNFGDGIIRECLQRRNIIDYILEFNVNKDEDGTVKDCRVLIRDNRKYQVEITDYVTGNTKVKDAHLCFVYSLTFNKIITAYWNEADDNHDTINWYRYKNIDVIKCMEECKKNRRKKARR